MKQTVRMNPNDLTVGDMEIFEEITGEDLMDAMKSVPLMEDGKMVPDPDNKGRPKMTVNVTAKAFRGLLFIALKKQNPELTLTEFRNIKISDIDFDLEDDQSPLDREDGSKD